MTEKEHIETLVEAQGFALKQILLENKKLLQENKELTKKIVHLESLLKHKAFILDK